MGSRIELVAMSDEVRDSDWFGWRLSTRTRCSLAVVRPIREIQAKECALVAS